jgi:hypothetical protein
MREYQKRRILIVVKTYPNPSKAHGETVCCAGVDMDTGRWVRVYPITFRQLAGRQFAKYQIIECRARTPRSDKRPESVQVDLDSIQPIGEPLPAGDEGWRSRMSLLPRPDASLERIRAAQARDGTSLGMFRPKRIEKLLIEAAKPWTERQRSHLQQQRLGLGEEATRELTELKQIPWSFSYRFSCDDASCLKPHTLQVLDWEIAESYRSWSRTYPDWEERIRQRYERELPARDLHLVVGNLAKRHRTFVIIGLVRPPGAKMDGGYVQQALDLVSEEGAVAGGGVGLETQQADSLGDDEGQEPLELFPDEG